MPERCSLIQSINRVMALTHVQSEADLHIYLRECIASACIVTCYMDMSSLSTPRSGHVSHYTTSKRSALVLEDHCPRDKKYPFSTMCPDKAVMLHASLLSQQKQVNNAGRSRSGCDDVISRTHYKSWHFK